MQLGMYIPIYTLLPYKEAIIDNFKKDNMKRFVSVKTIITNHAIMNVCTNIHLTATCTIMTVLITFFIIIYI